jgi:hypothetical protein
MGKTGDFLPLCDAFDKGNGSMNPLVGSHPSFPFITPYYTKKRQDDAS